MEEKGKKRYRKPLEKMNVIDDFLFNEIMADEKNGIEVCRLILNCVLKREVGDIHFTPQKVVPGLSEESHGIRLDAYVTESRIGADGEIEDISIYDVEPDKCKELKTGLPKRSRYYGDLIDVQLLEKNTKYDKLPELVTIFILSYDPFGENAMYYEAGTVLKTHPHVKYDDGIRRIFLYVGGKPSDQADKAEQSLKNLLVYINESKTENATDDNTRKLDAIVKSTKAKKGIGVKSMKSWERDNYIKETGREILLTGQIIKKVKKGKTVDLIAEDLETTTDEIRPIYDAVLMYPELDPEEIIDLIGIVTNP